MVGSERVEKLVIEGGYKEEMDYKAGYLVGRLTYYVTERKEFDGSKILDERFQRLPHLS